MCFFSLPVLLQSASLWATHVWSTSTHNTSCCYKPDQNPSSNKDAEEPLCSTEHLSSEERRILASVTSAFASYLHQYLQAKHFPGMKGKIVGNSEQVKSTVGNISSHSQTQSIPARSAESEAAPPHVLSTARAQYLLWRVNYKSLILKTLHQM